MSSSTPRTCFSPERPTTLGQVDLGDVAGHDGLRTEPEAGQEHLHLFRCRVLRLVEDDERVVQRAAAHVCERRDLDRAPLHQARDDFGFEHVVQRVVERSQVRVDLLQDVAGQEAEAFAGFHRGPGEDDAVDFLGLQRLHRERDREIALAGTGRTDRERHGVVAHRVDVPLLPRRLGPDRLAAAQHFGGEHIGRTLVGFQHLDRATEVVAVESVALFEQHDELFEQAADAVGVGRLAGDGDLVAAHEDVDRERAFDNAQQLVALARAGPP